MTINNILLLPSGLLLIIFYFFCKYVYECLLPRQINKRRSDKNKKAVLRTEAGTKETVAKKKETITVKDFKKAMEDDFQNLMNYTGELKNERKENKN